MIGYAFNERSRCPIKKNKKYLAALSYLAPKKRLNSELSHASD